MRDLSLRMLDHLVVPEGSHCVDLTCGTGFITAELARRSGRRAVGVDASPGMVAVARQSHGECDFEQADALEYLRKLPSDTADVITCGWGLGYTQPLAVVRQMARVLRRGGMVGIIDNSLFSLAEILWASLLTFAECPDALQHAMKVRFLPSSFALACMMRLSGLSVSWRMGGSKTHIAPSGQAAIDRLLSTGAAAGFEFAVGEHNREKVFGRFAQILDARYSGKGGVPITHRYLAAVARRRS
jgi:SAM-dependent methyltransferase